MNDIFNEFAVKVNYSFALSKPLELPLGTSRLFVRSVGKTKSRLSGGLLPPGVFLPERSKHRFQAPSVCYCNLIARSLHPETRTSGHVAPPPGFRAGTVRPVVRSTVSVRLLAAGACRFASRRSERKNTLA